ncbi:hypothetical protein O181_028795 [Austropuccinia psidii MF-1]|uniref:Tf2-1-like SH3-like domain-containing protein n=1 Tax=Austropuccinia psidii MF-1 TaxID=1389203 RepID=A0A9Q3CU31_9BASI|nr:hypothetical protein [Austropuccinia psidii MF-1]
MEEIHNLNQFTSLKILLLEGYQKIQSVQPDVKREIEVSINRFKRYADKGRASTPVFNPGDMVWLSSKNIKSTRPTKKLSERWLGPFQILKKFSTHASIPPVFHISLLEPVKTPTIPNQQQEPPPPIIFFKKMNGKSLKFWIPRSREENYFIWWNGKVSVKTQKDPLANQPKNSRISLNLSRIFILYILTSQDPTLQELDYFIKLGAERNYKR